jgi:hypothetical protein
VRERPKRNTDKALLAKLLFSIALTLLLDLAPIIDPISHGAPTISGVTTPDIADTAAAVDLQTDVPSRCFADYGTSTSYTSATFLDASHFYRQHLLVLSGLSASTTYHYRITCFDADGNSTVDTDRTVATTTSSPTNPKLAVPINPNSPDMSGAVTKTVCSASPCASGATRDYTLAQFQTAIDDAMAATGKRIIAVEAGQTVTGNFTLGTKADSNWIEIRSSAVSSLAAGKRVGSTNAANLFKITSSTVTAPLATTGATAHVNIVGAEITINSNVLGNAPGGFSQGGLVRWGTGAETAANQLPNNLRLDRCWIHGVAQQNTKRGVYANAEDWSIIDSTLEDFKDSGGDAQAILVGTAKRGLVLNTYVEGAGENFLAGGVDQTISGYATSDLTFAYSKFPWRLSWKWNDPTADGYAFTADTSTETLTSTAHGHSVNYQPVRLRTTGTLPAPLATMTDYYVRSTATNSLKLGNKINFTADASTDTLTATAHGMPNALEIRIDSSNSAPGGLNNNTNYYIINQTANTFQLATTVGGSAINITSAGSGTHYVRGGNPIDITTTGSGTHYLLINWVTKNNFEIKKAERVIIYASELGPWWESEQTGGTISFKNSNDDPDPVVAAKDIFVFRCYFPNVGAGIVINGSNNVAEESTDIARRISILHNLFVLDGQTMTNEYTGGSSSGNISFISTSFVSGGTENYPDDLSIRHNTFVNGRGVNRQISGFNDPLTGSQKGDRFIFQDNVLTYNIFGLKTGGTAEGTASLDAAMNNTNYTWDKNLVAGPSASYPAFSNVYVTAPTDIQFVNYNSGTVGGNFRLATGSAGHNAASDGSDMGADIDALERATLNTVSGDWATAPGGSSGAGGVKTRGKTTVKGKGKARS